MAPRPTGRGALACAGPCRLGDPCDNALITFSVVQGPCHERSPEPRASSTRAWHRANPPPRGRGELLDVGTISRQPGEQADGLGAPRQATAPAAGTAERPRL